MSLPDRPRAALSPPARALASSAADLGRRLVWRTLHPAVRGPYLEAPRPPALRRIRYTARDGHRADLHLVERGGGGAGEPVVVAHALGLGVDAYRYGERNLVHALADAGFSVYLLTHRGDPDASDRRSDFDTILEQDVPAALEAVRSHCGFEHVHWVGHGLGGQLGMVAAARGEPLATVVAVAAPVRFATPRTELRSLALLARLLPEGVRIPAHRFARAALPGLGQEEWMGEAPGARVRGALHYGARPVPAGLVEQVARWIHEGTLCSRFGLVDYVSTLGRAQVPLLAIHARDARVAGRWATEPAVRHWGHPDATLRAWDGRSLALLYQPELGEHVAAWLQARRRRAWGPAWVDAQSA